MFASVAYVALDAIAVIATLVAFSCLVYLAVITYREHALNTSRQQQTSRPQRQIASRPRQTPSRAQTDLDVCAIAPKGVLHHKHSSRATPSLQ